MKLELPELEQDKIAIPDLRRLKELSDRLHLSPKRASVIQWQNNIKELQSEGVYPITAKASKRSPFKKITEIPQDVPTITISDKISQDEDTKLHKNESEKIRESIKTKEENKTVENNPEVSKEKVLLRKHQRGKYFRQRSVEDCQHEIRQYLSNEKYRTKPEKEDKQITIGERYKIISLALEKIRTDLLNMRIQDNNLARKLLDQREELNQAKAEKTCDEHANMLDNFSWELGLEEELAEQLRSSDLPSTFLRAPDSLLRGSSPLRLMGISRMALDAKRFSVI